MIVIEIFKVKYGSIAIIVIISAQFLVTFMNSFGDWIPVPRGKQINLDSGVAGAMRGKPYSLPGNMMTGKVSIEKRLLDEKTIKENRVGGMHYFLDWLTFGNVTIYLTGQKWQWQEIPASQSDNKYGAIRFIGNLKGEPIWDDKEYPLYKEIKHLSTINSCMASALEEIEAQASNISAKQYIDIDAASQLIRTVSDRVKNIKIVTKGRGGDTEALASEMGQG